MLSQMRVLILGLVTISLLWLFHEYEPATEPPMRRTGEGCADGSSGLIKENEEVCGFVLIIMNSIIKHKNQPHCGWCKKHNPEETTEQIACVKIVCLPLHLIENGTQSVRG